MDIQSLIDNGVTEEQVREKCAERAVQFFGIHECSMCGYHCGYLINGDDVAFDSGCFCTGRFPTHRGSSFAEIAGHINLQTASFDGIHWRERYWRALDGETMSHVNMIFKKDMPAR